MNAVEMIKEAVLFADEVPHNARRVRGRVRLWNRQEGVQIDVGVRHAIVSWVEIEHARFNIIKARMQKLFEAEDRAAEESGR